MKKQLPNHLSHYLNVKLDKRPITTKDRSSTIKAGLGILIGYLFIISGLFDLWNNQNNTSNNISSNLKFSPEAATIKSQTDSLTSSIISDTSSLFYILTAIGAILIISQILSFIRCKKIIIGNKYVTVFNRSITGEVSHFWESIDNYQGVRYRTRVFQSGIKHSLQHIIELAHKDEDKTVPLYIGKKVKNIRKRWEKIARKLHMPTIVNNINGTIIRDIDDLDKSIKEQVNENKLKNEFDQNESVPKKIKIKQYKNDKIIFFNDHNWDFSSFLFAILLCISTISLSLIFLNLELFMDISLSKTINTNLFIENIFYILCTMIALPILMLFKKQKILITKNHIRHIYCWPIFRIKTKNINFKNIEAVDVVSLNEGKSYYLAITSDDVTIHFGNGYKLDDLNWLRKYFINELSK